MNLFDASLLHSSVGIRPLKRDDYDRHIFTLLAQLTHAPQPSRDEFEAVFDQWSRDRMHYCCVIERDGRIVAMATLVLEQKLIRNCAVRGRIEDVIVDGTCRGSGFGTHLVRELTRLSRALNCYKLSLDCSNEMIPFYERFGFTRETNTLTLRF